MEILLFALGCYAIYRLLIRPVADEYVKAGIAATLAGLLRRALASNDDLQAYPCFQDIRTSAIQFVKHGWDSCVSELGRKSTKVHQVSLACYSLAIAARQAKRDRLPDCDGLLWALHFGLKGVAENAASLPFTTMDYQIMQISQMIFVELTEQKSDDELRPVDRQIDAMLKGEYSQLSS